MKLSDDDIERLWHDEFFDVLDVLEMGASKYKVDGWLDSDGHGTSLKEMHDSMFHHLALSYSKEPHDSESGLDHLLHVATRALMLYTRQQRGIYNSKDCRRVVTRRDSMNVFKTLHNSED